MPWEAARAFADWRLTSQAAAVLFKHKWLQTRHQLMENGSELPLGPYARIQPDGQLADRLQRAEGALQRDFDLQLAASLFGDEAEVRCSPSSLMVWTSYGLMVPLTHSPPPCPPPAQKQEEEEPAASGSEYDTDEEDEDLDSDPDEEVGYVEGGFWRCCGRWDVLGHLLQCWDICSCWDVLTCCYVGTS